MKKKIALILSAALISSVLGGCGKDYDAETSTVYILKKGKIVSVDVESFDTDKYDKKGLENYIDEQIKVYNSENDGSVKLKKLTVKDNVATLTMEYDSAEDYMAFSGTELFCGSVAESLAKGYTFDCDFASVDGDVREAATSEFVNDDEMKVAVIKENVNVVVDGTVYYTSTENVKSVDKDTVCIEEGANVFSNGTETVENTESATEGTEAASIDGAIGEDDLEVGETETEYFDFSGTSDGESTDSFSNVFTYIIYK